tara:strand:+ start:1522 stop:2802 length:1281 start_codon:yes stop_codon:yes gene_type:complete
MIPANLISKKRDGIILNKDEINSFFNGYVLGRVSDAEMSAMLMAIYFNGMNEDETFSLVDIMVHSGSVLNFDDSKNLIGDKHSTGGVGDKVSLILAPVMASAGIKVPMIAGRSLAYTGGTIDKLESIPGFQSHTDLSTFKKWVTNNGYAIIAQSKEICPADKLIYSLRSKTGTVPSVPLICGSIMSKKIAEGISGLVLDIKIGNGAFMKTKKQANELGKWMTKIGTAFDIRTDVVYTNMNQPLGRFAGLSCEIAEAIDCLKGNGPDDLMAVTLELGSKLLIQSKIVKNKNDAIAIQNEIIHSGNALQTFNESVKSQGGVLENFYSLNKPKYEKFIYPSKQGTITRMDTESIGWILVEISKDKNKNSNHIDYSAGIEFLKKIGDTVDPTEPMFRMFNSNENLLDDWEKSLEATTIIGKSSNKIDLIL